MHPAHRFRNQSQGLGRCLSALPFDFNARACYPTRLGGGSFDGAAGTPVLEPLQAMIEALKSDAIVEKLGGRFKLTALIQRRLKELIMDGARPLVERRGRTDLEIVIEEILQDKITPDFTESGYAPPKTGKKR